MIERERWRPYIRVEDSCFFTREQLLARDYDPIAAGLVDLAYLEERFAHHVRLDHAAAVRGILVSASKRGWQWLWGIGLLHDHILVESGYPKLYARYRNQRGMLPRIEFHQGADVYQALHLLLESTPLQPDDLINIESEMGGRWMSVGDYFGANLKWAGAGSARSSEAKGCNPKARNKGYKGEACADAMKEEIRPGEILSYTEYFRRIRARGAWQDGTINQHLMSCLVNLPPARRHWKNRAPFLFLRPDGQYELFDGNRHEAVVE